MGSFIKTLPQSGEAELGRQTADLTPPFHSNQRQSLRRRAKQDIKKRDGPPLGWFCHLTSFFFFAVFSSFLRERNCSASVWPVFT